MTKAVYCDKCGMLIKDKDKKTGKWVCTCGFSEKHSDSIVTTEKIAHKKIGKGVLKEQKTAGFPHKCKKCGYSKADIDTISAMYSDESDISLYKCKKCGHVERETDGSGNAA
jgi:DNA-directed RNA polymerase subunit M/transcription elongation factor TFIIS